MAQVTSTYIHNCFEASSASKNYWSSLYVTVRGFLNADIMGYDSVQKQEYLLVGLGKIQLVKVANTVFMNRRCL